MKRTKRTTLFILAIALIAVILIIIFSLEAHAYTRFTAQTGADTVKSYSQPAELFGTTGVITTLMNTMLYVVGALSVVMLIVGGLRYVVSGGKSEAVTSAKNTVLYSIVGLIVAVLAYAAINFILISLGSGTNI